MRDSLEFNHQDSASSLATKQYIDSSPSVLDDSKTLGFSGDHHFLNRYASGDIPLHWHATTIPTGIPCSAKVEKIHPALSPTFPLGELCLSAESDANLHPP